MGTSGMDAKLIGPNNETGGVGMAPEVVFINPKLVEWCTPASVWTDLNQHDANRNHPHAFFNRGYFIESKRAGSIVGGDWDVPSSPRFSQLLEYVAVLEHIEEKKHWSHSEFCKRCVRAIELGYFSKGFKDIADFIEGRVTQLEQLIASIKRFGVNTADDICDNISINIDSNGCYRFNNRGHHRLAIAQILGLEKVPVLIVVIHENARSIQSVSR